MKAVVIVGSVLAALAVLLLLLWVAPSEEVDPIGEPDPFHDPSELSANERERIAQEIESALDDYKEANLRMDLDAQLNFWSDSDEFVFAGDGVILGGYEQWSDQLRQYDVENEAWNYWEMRNINVVVLSREAASATFEFEHSVQKTDGETVRTKGAWTYVLVKGDGDWRVIHGNGTHTTF